MDNIITVLLVMASVLFFQLLLNLINMKRIVRARQLLPVYFAPIYAAAALVIQMLYHDSTKSVFYKAIEEETLLENLEIVVVYIILKVVLMLVSHVFFRYNSRIAKYGGLFYDYDLDENAWFVEQRHANLRKNLNILSWVFAVLSGIYLGILLVVTKESPWYVTVYPACFMVVLTECVNYLSGYTKPEYLSLIYGDDIRSFKMGNYHKMKDILTKMFPEPLLLAHTGNNMPRKAGSKLFIDDMVRSDDELRKQAGLYYSNLKEDYNKFDNDLIEASIALAENKNTLIFHTFYRDLGDYLFFPLLQHLLLEHSILIVIGRESLKADVEDWLKEVTVSYARTGKLFRVAELKNAEYEDFDIGILDFPDIYDLDMLKKNEEWLQDVDFVIGIETSRFLSTSQVFLSVLASRINYSGKTVYCFLDHYREGLSDTLSHLFQIDLTNIVAYLTPKGVYTVMDWKANGDFRRQQLFNNEMHYLGNGTELAAAAIKNQVRKVSWYADEKAPLKDIRWLVRQYYAPITRYANLLTSQDSFDKVVDFVDDLYSSKQEDEAFVIAEDEEYNLFATVREYLDRGRNQSFINVLSENYLLRDYMRYNHNVFLNDPKAVAAVSPDYFKTERNVVYQLIIEMAHGEVSDKQISQQMQLLGYSEEDKIYKLLELIRKYTGVEEIFVNDTVRGEMDNDMKMQERHFYSVSREFFDEKFAKTLKRAYFVVEDEKLNHTNIDTRLFEHIPQLAMPGQLLTFDGKLYRVENITESAGCILRRAGDMYLKREYYRQIRKYSLLRKHETVHTRVVEDLQINKVSWDFEVTSTGYLAMNDLNDLRTAKLVDLSEDVIADYYVRNFNRKNVLEVVLPDSDENIRFTITLLLQEIFRTLFPDSWQYIAVLAYRAKDEEGMLDKFVYTLDGNYDQGSIYIVEDSDMDLGLLEAIDNNLIRILEIVADYLNWHLMKIKEPASKDPSPKPIELPKDLQRKKNFLRDLGRKIARLFGSQSDKQEKQKPEEEKVPLEPAEKPVEEKPVEIPVENTEAAEASENENKDEKELTHEEQLMQEDFIRVEGEEVIESDLLPDDLDLIIKANPSRYQKECFLKFGFDEIIGKLKLEDVSKYLTVRGLSNGDLAKARLREKEPEKFLDTHTANHCDFCGKPLSGVAYERLADGRVRCQECASTAINNMEEFHELFIQCRTMFEAVFNVTLNVSINVRMTDARSIARANHAVFKPSDKVAVRTLGYAEYSNGVYTICVENGTPRLAMIETITHELTHIWQYLNWNRRKIEEYYDHNDVLVDMVYEGMAVWASIQMLYVLGETSFAGMHEQEYAERDDIYGAGFRIYRERYFIVKDGNEPALKPFDYYPPL